MTIIRASFRRQNPSRNCILGVYILRNGIRLA
jgi:hypothetical protein